MDIIRAAYCDGYRACKVVPDGGRWQVVHPTLGVVERFASYSEAFDWIGAACLGELTDDEPDEPLDRYPTHEVEINRVDADDETWWTWYRLGYDCACAVPGPELTAAERAMAERAYDAGFEAGQEDRWDEVDRLWPCDCRRDRDPWDEARGIIAGRPGWCDYDAGDYSSEGH